MTNRPDLILSLHSAAAPIGGDVALCAAVALPDGDAAPEWIHLLPAGTVTTVDGRGPYRVADPAALVAASLQNAGGLVLDENHSTDLAAPKGEAAPARGWIVEMQARQDGIWGKVDWTRAGRLMMSGKAKAYRHISPAILHQPDGTVTAILRASLVNRPNLKGLTALHQETSMDFLKKLAVSLGLPETATEAEVMAAVASKSGSAVALQSALDPIAQAVGLSAGADPAAVLAGVQKISATGGAQATIFALQSELTGVTNQLNMLISTAKTEKATAFVDAAIVAGRVGVKPMRTEYIAMHMENPARTEGLINAMPILGGGTTLTFPTPDPQNGEISLNADQKRIAAMLGVSDKDYAATLKAEREATL